MNLMQTVKPLDGAAIMDSVAIWRGWPAAVEQKVLAHDPKRKENKKQKERLQQRKGTSRGEKKETEYMI